MKRHSSFAGALAAVALSVAWTGASAEDFAAPQTDGWHLWKVAGAMDNLHVYVRISDNRVSRIRALSANCPVTTQSPINEHGFVDGAASAEWLLEQIETESRVAEDAMAAISMHSSDVAFPALKSVLENRERRLKTREQALFWLVQVDSDDSFAYLDALLSSN